MKKALLLLFLASILATRAADPAPETKIFLDSDPNETDPKNIIVTEWYITSQQLEKQPDYKPSADNPPLSLKDAMAVAEAELQKHLTPKMTWTLDSIELHQIDAGNSGETSSSDFLTKPTGKWFYKVIFSTVRPDPKTSIWTAPYPVYVLMDGTTATRRERPQTKEEKAQDEQFAQGLKDAVMKDAKKAK